MIYLVAIISWFLLGALAVVLDGFLNRFSKLNTDGQWALMLFGLISFIVVPLVHVIIIVVENTEPFSISAKLYKLGQRLSYPKNHMQKSAIKTLDRLAALPDKELKKQFKQFKRKGK